MITRQDRARRRIRDTWRMLLYTLLVFAVVFGMARYFYHLKEKAYQREYNSTTWRQTTAVLYRTSAYEKREETDDGTVYTTYYTWYFHYQGLDGNTYSYSETGKAYAAAEGYTTTIYVDEADDAHALEIKDFAGSGRRLLLICGMVLLPVAAIFGLRLLVLYLSAGLAPRPQDRW